MTALAFVILILIILTSLSLGLFLFFNPALAIKIQKSFYARINWKIEPVSMPRELRNTKMMGLFLIIISIATAIHLFFIF